MKTIRNVGIVEHSAYTASIPGSKSYTNRALIVAAQRVGTTRVKNALICDDTRYLAQALDRFGGLHVEQVGGDFVVDRDAEQLTAPSEPLYVGGAGTPARFLLAFAAAADGQTTVTGNARLSERPMGDLLDSLARMGVPLVCKGRPGCLPVTIRGARPKNFHWRVNGTVSSQFLSSLLLFAAQQDADRVEIAVEGGLVSRPYVRMTLAMLRDVGIDARETDSLRFVVVPGRPRRDELTIEPDASGMSYLLTAAAVTRSTVTIPGIGSESAQGDVGLVHAYARMGCKVKMDSAGITLTGGELRGIDIDMETMPDVVLSLAIAATQANSPTYVYNIANLRVKECDRIAAICDGLHRLGIQAEQGPDWVRIHPGRPAPGMVKTFDDHRVAMAFSLLALLYDGITLDDYDCVTKSFPGFWAEMGRFCDHALGETRKANDTQMATAVAA